MKIMVVIGLVIQVLSWQALADTNGCERVCGPSGNERGRRCWVECPKAPEAINFTSEGGTATPASPQSRVTCDNFLLRPWGPANTYMAFVRENPSSSWVLFQNNLNCVFNGGRYFNCSNLESTVALVDYEQKCFPANNPHHEQCYSFPKVEMATRGGPSKLTRYRECKFAIELRELIEEEPTCPVERKPL